jgi:hypothetical protein
MKNVPQPKEQARVLKTALSQLGLTIKHQDALSVVASMMGVRDWPTLSASFEASEEHRQAAQKALSRIDGPADGDLYEALVTVDQTMSARIRVRAHSREDAQRMFGAAACAQYPHGFELDEGNYRGPSDFYLGDSDAVDNLSEPEIDTESGDFSASATWRDDRFSFRIDLSRDEPDCSNDERRAKATETITVSLGDVNVQRTVRQSIYDDLGDYLRDVLDDGDYDDVFDELAAKLERKLKRQAK